MRSPQPQARLTTLSRCLALSLAVMAGALTSLEDASAQSGRGAADAAAVEFNIPAGELAVALDQFAEQSGLQIVSDQPLLQGARVPALRGRYAPEEALTRLLKGSGFGYERINAQTLVLKKQPAQTPPDRQAGQTAVPAAARTEQPDIQDLGRVAVTGTRVRGAELASPLMTITQEDMRLSGHTGLGDVIRAIPQNFSGGQNLNVGIGATEGGNANQNVSGASSLNLRGLGADATLTLLNGTRLPYDSYVQATDVSVIPLAAIDRMEVLLDGASAIYGSDAVGGVANIILKKDYDGAEVSVRYGRATDGGYQQHQYTGVAGRYWGTGGFLVSGDVTKHSEVRLGDRKHLLGTRRVDDWVYPQVDQKGFLFNGHQQAGSRAEISLTGFYTERAMSRFAQMTSTLLARVDADYEIWGVTAAVDVRLGAEWSLRAHGVVGKDSGRTDFNYFSVATGAPASTYSNDFINKVDAAGIEAEGPVFTLPAGEARVSVGGGLRRNTFDAFESASGTRLITGSTRSHYGYAEINLPIVSAQQQVPLVNRLSMNGAIRYESYDTFGQTSTPKLGLVWGLTPNVDIKASWGKSFKIPTLQNQFSERALVLVSDTQFIGTPGGSTVIVMSGGNANLEPEQAEVVTAGMAFRPGFMPGLGLELSWFKIDYTDRVVLPFVPYAAALVTPAAADYVIRNPTIEQQNAAFSEMGRAQGDFTSNRAGAPYDPSTVYAIADYRYVNAASQRTSGFDASAVYMTQAWGGSLSFNGNLSWIADSEYQLTRNSDALPRAGIAYFTPKFRGRIGGSYARGGFTLSSNVNHTGGVTNTYVQPHREGGSMTTVDVVGDYQVSMAMLGKVGLNLAILNVFNSNPPYMRPIQSFYPPFDTTNYVALGRVINLTLTKTF